jgi:hypothetical protein
MAHADTIDHAFLIQIAQAIGSLIDNGLADERESSESQVPDENSALRLGETLSVWKLRAVAYENLQTEGLSGDLSDWVEPTDIIHQQLRLRGSPAGFALCRLGAEPGELITHLNTSDFAARMDHVFEVIERNEQGDSVVAADPVVRVLEVPAYHVSVLWLFAEQAPEDPSRVVIVSAPESYKKYPGPFLRSSEFFMGLKERGAILDVA